MTKSDQKKPHYEFMGPPGALGNTIALPLLVLSVPIVCNKLACPAWDASSLAVPTWEQLVEPTAFLVTGLWFLAQAIIYVVFPGPVVEGTVVKALGAKLKYKCNGVPVWCPPRFSRPPPSVSLIPAMSFCIWTCRLPVYVADVRGRSCLPLQSAVHLVAA